MGRLSTVMSHQTTQKVVGSGSYVIMDSITFSPGTYIIEIAIEFLTNGSNGVRAMAFTAGSGGSYGQTDGASCAPTQYTILNRTYILKIEEQTTYNIYAYQTSGEDNRVNSVYRYVRLAA